VLESDLPIFFEHQRDPLAVEMADFRSRDLEAFMAHWHKIMHDEISLLRTVVFRGEVAGNVESFMRGDVREVGYWLGREYWGKGIATKALSLFLNLEKRRPLYAGVVRHNAGSLRVLEKCGFVAERQEGGDVIFKLT
jgi:RimJ/RimL family protein N-acetyltransferase